MAIPKKIKDTLKKPTMPVPIAAQAVAETKKFTVEDWQGGEGEKIIIYGDTGIGKSSLSLLTPSPVFIGLDEGGRKLKDPTTGQPAKRITISGTPLRTFSDVRAVLRQVDLYEGYKTAVIDTVTVLEDWAIAHVVNTIPTKAGQKVANIEAYGWKEGYRHLYDAMRSVLADCDELIRRGKNVVLIAQGATHKVQHPGADDFLRAGPRLYGGNPSVEALYSEWANEIYRIAYHNVFIKERKISGQTERAVFAQPEVWFRAKSREGLDAVISFENQTDDSVWRFLFPGEYDDKPNT